MSHRLPPLNPLRAFELTARYLSVKRAAQELSVTPGAVSHQIRVLEDALEAKLFLRGTRNLRLTSDGSALLPVVASAFDSIAEASNLLKRNKTSGDLVVSCVQAVASHWLIPHLQTFLERHPGVRLKLLGCNDDSDVLSSHVDVCILYGSGPWPDRHVQLWTQLDVFPVCSPTLINAKPLKAVEDLRHHTLLHGDEGYEWQNWLSAARAPLMRNVRSVSLSNWHMAIEAALDGLGVSLGDNVTTARLVAEGALVTPFNLRLPAPGALYIVCRNESRNAPLVSAFSEWLIAELGNDRKLTRGRSSATKSALKKKAAAAAAT